jgi:hypothetical protein
VPIWINGEQKGDREWLSWLYRQLLGSQLSRYRSVFDRLGGRLHGTGQE